MTFEQISLIIGIIVLTLITYKVFVGYRSQQLTLRDKFLPVNDLKGKTLDEIIAAAGPPKEGERLDAGIMIYTWHSEDYTIILRFVKENGVSICTDILSQEG